MNDASVKGRVKDYSRQTFQNFDRAVDRALSEDSVIYVSDVSA